MKSSASTTAANSLTSNASTTAAPTRWDCAGRHHARTNERQQELGKMRIDAAHRERWAGFLVAALLAVLVIGGMFGTGRAAGWRQSSQASARAAVREQEQTIIAAGDIVDCPNVAGSEATAKLLDSIPG